MLRLAFDFIITWRETRTRPNAYIILIKLCSFFQRLACITKKSNKSIFRMESAGVDIPDIAQKKSQN